MNLQKRISWYSGIAAFVSLILAILLHWTNREFLANIFIGLFSSGVLICLTAVLTYLDNRRSELQALYIGCSSFQKALTRNLRDNNRIDIYTLKDNLEIIMESYKSQIYCHLCELSAIEKGTDLDKIIEEFYEAVRHIYLFVCEDRETIVSFLLGNISSEELQSYEFKHVGAESVAYLQKLNGATDRLAVFLNFSTLDERSGTRDL